jgi:hypothetical protein
MRGSIVVLSDDPQVIPADEAASSARLQKIVMQADDTGPPRRESSRP